MMRDEMKKLGYFLVFLNKIRFLMKINRDEVLNLPQNTFLIWTYFKKMLSNNIISEKCLPSSVKSSGYLNLPIFSWCNICRIKLIQVKIKVNAIYISNDFAFGVNFDFFLDSFHPTNITSWKVWKIEISRRFYITW